MQRAECESSDLGEDAVTGQALSSSPLTSPSFPPQDEKNQMMTTNVWLKQVGARSLSGVKPCQGGHSL